MCTVDYKTANYMHVFDAVNRVNGHREGMIDSGFVNQLVSKL